MNEILQDILAIVVNTVLVINISMFLEFMFGIRICKKRSQYLVIGSVFLIVNTLIELFFEGNVWVQMLTIYGYMVVSAWLSFKENIFKVAFYVVVAIFLDIQFSGIMEIVSTLFGLDKYTLVLENETMTFMAYLSEYVTFLILVWLCRYTAKKNITIQLKLGEAIFLFCFCIFSPLVTGIFEVLDDTFQYLPYSIAWMAFVIFLNVAVFYGIIYRNHAKYYKELSQNYKEQFVSEYAYFQDYKEKQKDMVKFRHDYKNHMLVLESMLKTGKYEKAKEYFNQLPEQGESSGKKILTGNEITDIILSAKSQEITENNIEVICNGGLEPLGFMKDVDCCILFSNLMDNAIEANKKCKEHRHITIKSTQTQAICMIEISNRTKGDIEWEGEHLKTTKKDKSKHGIGSRNVIEIIEKYQGEYKIFVREKDFVIQMMFYIDRLSQK